MRLPVVGDRVLFVLRKLGAGVASTEGKPQVKIRAAIVTEDWKSEPHPVDAWKKKGGIGKPPVVRGPAGKDFLGEDGKPTVPPGTVNLEIHLDGHARRDLNAGHNKYEGDVLYDPAKSPGTWHWPGD